METNSTKASTFSENVFEKKKTMEETHKRVTFLIKRETVEAYNRLLDELGEGANIKTEWINIVLESAVAELKRAVVEKRKKNSLSYYMSLNYTYIHREVNRDVGNYFYGKIDEFDGCEAFADTKEELFNKLNEIKRDLIEIKLKHGDPIPAPYEISTSAIIVEFDKV